ncbi:hypothetical protein [Ferrovibrio sp.]|uniref:hypothetical protein n=1 Tax=Ferrovibrio sp. TaxID=1917215 RepID=UPI0035B3F921
MSEQAMILSAKTWNDCANQERGIKPNRMIAAYAALIDQQAARIAELESEITRARSLSDTEIELLRRALRAEDEVKRLRERFQIGDPVTLRAGYKYGEWVGVPLFIAGMSAAYGSGLIDVALCEKWPPQRNGDRWTDGFSIDDIEKRALTTQQPRHD